MALNTSSVRVLLHPTLSFMLLVTVCRAGCQDGSDVIDSGCNVAATSSAMLQVASIRTEKVQSAIKRSGGEMDGNPGCEQLGVTSSADECLQECYRQEDESARAAADREMAWGIAGSVVGAAGGSMGGKSGKGSSLLQRSPRRASRLGANHTNHTVHLTQQKGQQQHRFVMMAMGAIALATEIGGAVNARQEAYASIASVNCERLASELMSDTLDDIVGSIDEMRVELGEIKEELGEMQNKMMEQFESLDHKTDELMAAINLVSAQQTQMDLNTKTTHYMECAGNIHHVYGMVQEGFSDKETYVAGLNHILHDLDSGSLDKAKAEEQAAVWRERYAQWSKQFIQLLDAAVVHALDGMRCMSILISHGNLLELYYGKLIRDALADEMKGLASANQGLNSLYKLVAEAGQRMSEEDSILMLTLACISELRTVLSAVPRTSYWEDFSTYVTDVQGGLNHVLARSKTSWYMQYVREAVKEELPLLFPVKAAPHRPGQPTCKELLVAEVGPEVAAGFTMWTESAQPTMLLQILVEDASGLIPVEDGIAPYERVSHVGRWYMCGMCNAGVCFMNAQETVLQQQNSHVDSAKFQEVPVETWYGFNDLDVSGTYDERLAYAISSRVANMNAWACRIQDVSAKADAISETSECILHGNLPASHNESASVQALECDFEEGWGSWTSDTSGSGIAWTHKSGVTPSSGTGPSHAYSGEYYMFTEATGNFNTPHVLLSPHFQTDVPVWLSFEYHMKGSSMGTLKIENQNGYKLWEETGDKGDEWFHIDVNVPAGTTQIRITGTTGTGYRSDISIDAIKVWPYLAEGQNTAVKCLGLVEVDCPDGCSTYLPSCQESDV